MSQEWPKVDKRIGGIVGPLAIRIYNEKIEPGLKNNHLVDEEGNAMAPLTETGVEQLARSTAIGVHLSLSQSRISSPVGAMFDEIELTDRLMNGLGNAIIKTDEHSLKLTFDNPSALISEIEVPLDPANAMETSNGPRAKVNTKRLDLTGLY